MYIIVAQYSSRTFVKLKVYLPKFTDLKMVYNVNMQPLDIDL